MGMRVWWTKWGDLSQRLLAIAGSLASLVGVVVGFFPKEPPRWVVVLLVLAIVCLAVFVILELAAHRRRHVFAKSDAEGIKRYMHAWIQHGGRVAIWSRDLSWAHNAVTRRLLTDKSARGELILSLPEPIPLSNELAAAGAEVCTYGARRLESPASRFTIAFFGRAGSRVAVGHEAGEVHIIDEFHAGEHPAFYLAEDLIALARTSPAAKSP